MITRRARASRVALLSSIPLVALVTFAAGCGTVTTPPSGSGSGTTHTSGTGTAGKPTPVPTVTGGTVTPGEPSCAGWPSKAARVRLPASFDPVAALRCVNGTQLIPGKGEWQTATLQRADTGLAAFTAALRLPPGHRTADELCPMIAMLPPQVAVVSGSGSTIIPLLPTNGCGGIQNQVLTTLAGLPWKPVSVRLISQIETPQEVASGCTPASTDPFALYDSTQPSAGGAVFSALPPSVRICVYSTGGAANTAQFLRGTSVTGSTETALLTGLSGARSNGVCQASHSMFAVVQAQAPNAPVVYVELGGCNRVLRSGSVGGRLVGMSIGQASAQAVAIIENATHQKP